jgi:NAD(P)-dependent dehydrogenase (short-subunit alcohol dehydrogenase family)
MPGRLENKIVLITGGATGIGRAASLLFSRQGAKVAVADRNMPEGEKTVSLIKDEGGDACFIQADVSKSIQVAAMVDSALTAFGGLNILVNNAGVLIRTSALHEVSEMEWDLTLNTNLRGVFLSTKYAIPHLLVNGGAIVNVSSGAGTGPSTNAVPYGVSKAGVIQLTMTTSREYAPRGVRCNVIVPGLIDTPQARGSTGSTDEFLRSTSRIAVGRVGTPEDIANLMLFLACDESSYISGSAFNINGGGSI